jgi:hypothetical protein
VLQTEKDELLTNVDQAQRARRQQEQEAAEVIRAANDMSAHNVQLASHARRVEAEMHAVHVRYLIGKDG